jgi:hypothetical protein
MPDDNEENPGNDNPVDFYPHVRRKPVRRPEPLLAIIVDERVTLKLDYDLACELRILILGANPSNPALIALGKRLPEGD